MFKAGPTSELSVIEKAKAGLLALNARTFVIYCLQAISVLVLSRLLTPTDYGTFGIVNGWVGFSVFFTDIGIAGALVQQKEQPTTDQLTACAWTQVLLASLFTLVFWIAAPYLIRAYSLPSEDAWMIRTLVLTLPIFAARSAPRLVIERSLMFGVIAKIEVLESILGYVVQIGLAIWKPSPWCFIIAGVLRAVLGTVFIHFVYAKMEIKRHLTTPTPALLARELKPLLRYGAAFQANAIIPALRSLMVPLVLASLLSVNDVGLITWASGMAAIPLFLAYNYNQVLFPSISRIQKNPELSKVVNRSMQIALLGFAALYGFGACASGGAIDFLFSKKWLLAKPLVPAACLASGLATARYLCASVLNATGRPGVRLWIECFSIPLEFAAAWLMIRGLGIKGYFPALVCSGVIALLLTMYMLRNEFESKTFKRLALFFAAALIPYEALKTIGLQNNLILSPIIFLVGFAAIILLVQPRLKSEFFG